MPERWEKEAEGVEIARLQDIQEKEE